MARNHREAEILSKALALAEEKNLHAAHALLQALSDLKASDAERKASQEAYAQAIMTVPIGHGLNYDRELLWQAFRTSGEEPPPGGKKKQRTIRKEKKETEMSDTNTIETTNNENSETAPTPVTDNVQNLADAKKAKAGRGRKYNIGDRYGITGNFGLQPIAEKDGAAPSIEFQLSYKEKKCQERGFGVIPAGTEVLYLGCRNVFGESSKKMVFKVFAGTLLADGSKLDRDVEAAGVVSHIVDTASRTSTSAATTEAEAAPAAEAVGA